MRKRHLYSETERVRGMFKDFVTGADDATASKYVGEYPAMQYDGSLIKAGTRIQWNEGLKRASVDLWDLAQNTPDAAPNLWEDISYYGGYRVIPATITAALAFSAGEIGYWPNDGKFYQAINNGTVWTPSAYAAAWKAVTP